jgi:hypothetical protein
MKGKKKVPTPSRLLHGASVNHLCRFQSLVRFSVTDWDPNHYFSSVTELGINQWFVFQSLTRVSITGSVFNHWLSSQSPGFLPITDSALSHLFDSRSLTRVSISGSSLNIWLGSQSLTGVLSLDQVKKIETLVGYTSFEQSTSLSVRLLPQIKTFIREMCAELQFYIVTFCGN